GRGPFAENYTRRGIEWQAPGVSTIQYLARHGVMDTRPLLAHCVRVDERDVETMRDAGAGVAHCPKSNAKLGHGHAPFSAFLKTGLRVGIGSDSVASNNLCDLLEEARSAALFARAFDASPNTVGRLGARKVLRAATLGGAQALWMDNKVGALAEGFQADLAVVSLGGAHQRPVYDPADALVFASSGRDVLLTMVAGKEVYSGGRVLTVDEEDLRARVEEIGRKLRS
ncbi:MAG TPA: amidohydrolase family protein, partial [Pyrinomonadaceae bacterium]